MTADGISVALAALIDGASLLQGQIAAIAQANSRIEQTQRDILARLDTINAGQAAITDILPILETILGRVIDEGLKTDAGYQSVVKVLGALADGHTESRAELAAIVPALEGIAHAAETSRAASVRGFGNLLPLVEAISHAASADRDAIEDVLLRVASGVERLLELSNGNQTGKGGEVPGLEPVVKQILDNQLEDRKLNRAGFIKASTIAAFSYSTASGHRGPLPVAMADDPLLEMYILSQPADLSSNERALVDWRAEAKEQGTAELFAILKTQYQPSPTDTPETRLLRYRLAAVTRETIKGRGAEPPSAPTSTRVADRSAVSCMIRSQELAQLWRAGESAALYAEPEPAGAIDLFALAERRVGPVPEGQHSPELVALHRDLATRVETGNRPSSPIPAHLARSLERLLPKARWSASWKSRAVAGWFAN